MYIDKLEDIVNKYNNSYYSAVPMKPVDVKLSTYIDLDKKNNKEDPKFNHCDHVRISKYKNYAKRCFPNWSEEVFVIKKIKNTLPRT